MNYIHKLKADLAEREAELKRLNENMDAFVSHLHSDKFAGHESDGARKDWISTGDVLTWLREIRSGALC